MKKLLILFLFLLSCKKPVDKEEELKYVQISNDFKEHQNSQSNQTESIINNIFYFRDSQTNLCFAGIKSFTNPGYLVTSITCVPCDSLRHIKVYEIKK